VAKNYLNAERGTRNKKN